MNAARYLEIEARVRLIEMAIREIDNMQARYQAKLALDQAGAYAEETAGFLDSLGNIFHTALDYMDPHNKSQLLEHIRSGRHDDAKNIFKDSISKHQKEQKKLEKEHHDAHQALIDSHQEQRKALDAKHAQDRADMVRRYGATSKTYKGMLQDHDEEQERMDAQHDKEHRDMAQKHKNEIEDHMKKKPRKSGLISKMQTLGQNAHRAFLRSRRQRRLARRSAAPAQPAAPAPSSPAPTAPKPSSPPAGAQSPVAPARPVQITHTQGQFGPALTAPVKMKTAEAPGDAPAPAPSPEPESNSPPDAPAARPKTARVPKPPVAKPPVAKEPSRSSQAQRAEIALHKKVAKQVHEGKIPSAKTGHVWYHYNGPARKVKMGSQIVEFKPGHKFGLKKHGDSVMVMKHGMEHQAPLHPAIKKALIENSKRHDPYKVNPANNESDHPNPSKAKEMKPPPLEPMTQKSGNPPKRARTNATKTPSTSVKKAVRRTGAKTALKPIKPVNPKSLSGKTGVRTKTASTKSTSTVKPKKPVSVKPKTTTGIPKAKTKAKGVKSTSVKRAAPSSVRLR